LHQVIAQGAESIAKHAPYQIYRFKIPVEPEYESD
jgi:hypothetical protein